MSWANLDDGFADHPKVIDLPDAAFRLHVCAMCWCSRRLTDGLVRSRELRILGAMLEGCPDDEQLRELVKKLVKARLWESCEEGWRLHDWLKHNESASKVTERREAAKQRMAENRRKAAEKSRTFADSSREHSDEHVPERAGEVRSPSPLLSSPLPNPTEEAKASSLAVGLTPPPPPVGLSGQSQPRQESQQGALIPDILPSPKPSPERSRNPRKAPEPTRVALAWRAYCEAIKRRYPGEVPIWNAKMGGIFGKLVKDFGDDAAPMAAFYVGHNHRTYIEKKHVPEFLALNATTIHREWQAGEAMTATRAQQAERTASNPFLEELAERRRARAAAEQIECQVEGDHVKR